MRMFCKVSRDVRSDSALEVQLEDLDFEYCLPYWAWTKFEWAKYQLARNKILKEIERIEDECVSRE